MRTLFAILSTLILCSSPAAAWQNNGQADTVENAKVELTHADAAAVKRLLAEFDAARKEGDATEVVGALLKMVTYNNVDFIDAAKEGLVYRATRVDKGAVKAQAAELGIKDKDEISDLLLAREASVQIASAHIMGNFRGEKKAISALTKAFKDKSVRKEKPTAMAAVIATFGKMGYAKVQKDVFSEFKRFRGPEVARACVRYFGQIKCKDKGILRALCAELSAPEPGNIDAASNPPASYWEGRWRSWNAIRRDVSWALKEITGQVFKPAEGKFPGDTKKANDYIKAHARELGVK